jgi:holo-[acyl-carrier protein] synthase
MNRFHLGVDIISVKRIEAAFEKNKEAFLKKFLTDKELTKISLKDARRIAGRWAAKEALFKAFSSAGLESTYKDFEIANGEKGEPLVHHRFTDWQVEISLSHEDDYAIAYCQIKKIQP